MLDWIHVDGIYQVISDEGEDIFDVDVGSYIKIIRLHENQDTNCTTMYYKCLDNFSDLLSTDYDDAISFGNDCELSDEAVNAMLKEVSIKKVAKYFGLLL